MSGHSKWASIKHQKGAADAKRANVFTKLANTITVAARNGADPTMNFQLRLAIDKAKASNMPKDNIERAITRASGTGAAAVEELLYEIYGPHGTAILIDVATDNRNRAIADVKAILNKHGGKLANQGAVQYLFERQGEIVVEAASGTADDEIEMQLIDAGAIDYSKEESDYIVATDASALEAVKKALEATGFKVIDAKLHWVPKQTVALSEEDSEKVIKLLTLLDDLDDVVAVASNIA